jgi:hypothetical protein
MVPTDCKYTKSHEWIKVEGDTAVVGITDHAQDALGDITFVELPKAGAAVEKGKECGVIESVKAASDLYSPVSGEVAEVNDSLETTPMGPYGCSKSKDSRKPTLATRWMPRRMRNFWSLNSELYSQHSPTTRGDAAPMRRVVDR